MHVSILYIVSFIAAIHAFTITSPMAGQKLDPSQPITFSWTFDSTDPASFNLFLNQLTGVTTMNQIAMDVSTFAASYIISAGSLKSNGGNYSLVAEGFNTGAVLATSSNFTLSMTSASSSTFTGSVTAGVESGTAAASSSAATMASNATTGSASAHTTTSGMTSATGSNSFTTSTVSRSSTGTAASSAASATSSQNAQPKLGSSSQIAFTAAGLIAGLAALLA